jgi:hypothetical protein
MARSFLTNEMWEKLAPLLPPERGATGRPQHSHRPWNATGPWAAGTAG